MRSVARLIPNIWAARDIASSMIHDQLKEGPLHLADDHLEDVAGFLAIKIIKIGLKRIPYTARDRGGRAFTRDFDMDACVIDVLALPRGSLVKVISFDFSSVFC